MSRNDPPPKSCGSLSLPTELLLEIFSEVLAPEFYDMIQIQRIPRRRLHLYGPCEAYMNTERDRCNLRHVSKRFKRLTDAHPRSPVVSIDQTNWPHRRIAPNYFSFTTFGVQNLAAMRLLLNINSAANFLLATPPRSLPRLVSLSIQIVECAVVARNHISTRPEILQIISKACPGVIDLDLRNIALDHDDCLGWLSGFRALNLPKLRRLVLHSVFRFPVRANWNIISAQTSWTLPSLRHLSVDPSPNSVNLDTYWRPLGTCLLTLSLRTSLRIESTFWTTFPALQELEIVRLSPSPYEVCCRSPPPAFHPIRRVIIRGEWSSYPEGDHMHALVDNLFRLTVRPSPVEWLVCDDKSINGLNKTQWQQYKESLLFQANYSTRPEVCEPVMEKWVTGAGT